MGLESKLDSNKRYIYICDRTDIEYEYKNELNFKVICVDKSRIDRLNVVRIRYKGRYYAYPDSLYVAIQYNSINRLLYGEALNVD